MNSTPSKRAPWAPGAEALAAASKAIHRIAVEGRSAEDALSQYEGSRDRAAIRAITLGTVRWYLRLLPAVESLLENPERLAIEIRTLLVASAHQIVYSRNPAHSTVDSAVDAARVLKQERTSGVVNAVLRKFSREHKALLANGDAYLAVRTAHPAWLVERISTAWPEQVNALLEANNGHPPMVLRVDSSRTTVADYLAELTAAGLSGQAISWAPSAVKLDQPVQVAALPGFKEGRVSVQDSGAQLAAPLLECEPGMRVLDACAAPGGKTGHLLELESNLRELVAIDIEGRRLKRVQENLDRLGKVATLVAADVRDPQALGERQRFDRILLDAPCSSTGVIRRHPDIKLLRRPTDIGQMATTQLEILRACFRMLSPGGRLLYSVCSVLPDENEAVLAEFLRHERRARPRSLPRAMAVPGALQRQIGVQFLPGTEAGTDGFHYACLEKTTYGT